MMQNDDLATKTDLFLLILQTCYVNAIEKHWLQRQLAETEGNTRDGYTVASVATVNSNFLLHPTYRRPSKIAGFSRKHK